MSVIEVGIQVFLRVEGFAAQAAGPLRWSVLMFRLLLGSKNVPTFVERTLQRQFHLMFLQNWHPSLKKTREIAISKLDNYHFSSPKFISQRACDSFKNELV